MANIFPSLSPTVRVYSTGNFVVADTFAANGSYNAFRRGSRQVRQTLQMEFAYLTEENMNLIKAHYLERKGTFDFFLASSALWGDYSDDPPVELLGNTAWRFASPPAVTDTSYDRFNVSVALESHAILQGDILSVGASSDPATSFDYIYDALTSSATPARQYTIDPGAS